ncbi:hypothetical protein BKA62DRAFT_675233 [Auriculariales sp. MPI-PUGE-AT-0066]|nr:hypothetical protein BKA62DRAFT_675233 [Auriculariales sp. MPI-PUGE-AT-0066]
MNSEGRAQAKRRQGAEKSSEVSRSSNGDRFRIDDSPNAYHAGQAEPAEVQGQVDDRPKVDTVHAEQAQGDEQAMAQRAYAAVRGSSIVSVRTAVERVQSLRERECYELLRLAAFNYLFSHTTALPLVLLGGSAIPRFAFGSPRNQPVSRFQKPAYTRVAPPSPSRRANLFPSIPRDQFLTGSVIISSVELVHRSPFPTSPTSSFYRPQLYRPDFSLSEARAMHA